LNKIKQQLPDTAVIIISGQEDVRTAISLLKDGAFDYIVKDEDTQERLWNALMKIAQVSSLKNEVEHLKTEVTQKYDFSKVLIGNSDAMKKVYALIDKASRTNITVSITGETGTGKEVAARAIHYNSERNKGPFVAVNVAAIPKDLIESELFGHEKGAFTGAVTRRSGKFEEGNGGTLFLDEIAELDISLQSKLLRVVQEREVTRIGGNQVIPIDVRIIVATHRNLLQEVQNKTFREDLYYRLLGLPVELPPLRERDNDILVLAKHFADTFCKENKMSPKALSPGAQKKLKEYAYPGNIRELKSVIELACVLSDENIIEEQHINLQTVSGVNALLAQDRTLRQYEQYIIQHYLDKYEHDILLVAEKLDIGKSTIYRMLQAGEIK
jgi:DNA-binding NtrC family response regulator